MLKTCLDKQPLQKPEETATIPDHEFIRGSNYYTQKENCNVITSNC